MNHKIITERLIECREKKGWSKNEASKRIGISQPAYLRYESGERNPSVQMIKEIAALLNTSYDYLTGISNNAEVDSYTITKSSNPELFALIERCNKTDDDKAVRLLAYLDSLE